MVVNRKVTGTASSIPVGLAAGACVNTAITLSGALLVARLILNGRIPTEGIGYCSMIILLASSALGACMAVSRIKHRRVYVCVLSGLTYYALLLAATALFFDGQYRGMDVTALVIMAGVGTVALGQRKQVKKSAAGRRKTRRR